MVKCEGCFYLQSKWRERRVPYEFVEPKNGPGFGSVVDSPLICQHPFCFVTKTAVSPTKGKYTYKERIRGQAQMNKHNDCQYFYEPTVWDCILNLFGCGKLSREG